MSSEREVSETLQFLINCYDEGRIVKKRKQRLLELCRELGVSVRSSICPDCLRDAAAECYKILRNEKGYKFDS